MYIFKEQKLQATNLIAGVKEDVGGGLISGLLAIAAPDEDWMVISYNTVAYYIRTYVRTYTHNYCTTEN